MLFVKIPRSEVGQRLTNPVFILEPFFFSFFRHEKQNSYMVQAGQLYNEVSLHDVSSRNANQGMHIGCHIDISTGILSFTANGKDAKQRFKVSFVSNIFLIKIDNCLR